VHMSDSGASPSDIVNRWLKNSATGKKQSSH
jgi:hypothetical protein